MPRLDRYQDQKVYDALAGDYVLGTMGGRARRRFKGLMIERGYVQQAVADWERRLNPLGVNVAAVEPPFRVWRNIRREIRAEGKRRATFWNSLPVWRATAVATVLLLAGLIVYRTTVPLVTPTPSYVAVLVNEDQAPMIVASATRHPQRLMIIMMQKPPIAPNVDLELWAIPQAGGSPISMGVLPKSQKSLIELDEEEMRLIPRTGTLAISREPKGGSPSGGPTGPVMYQGHLVTL